LFAAPWSIALAKPERTGALECRTVTRIEQAFSHYLRDDAGATAIEYALIASILGIALLPVLTNTTSGMASLYTRVEGYFNRF
jgi:Flp pilus assembly pilin Flp